MLTEPTSTVDFPAFCVGSPATARRRLTMLAGTWAAWFKESRQFPAMDLVQVEAGSLIFTEAAFDLDGRPGVRIYLVPELLSAIQRALGWASADDAETAFEAGIRHTCWGALSLGVGRRRPDTSASVHRRVQDLLRCWPALDRFRYVDTPAEPKPFSAVVERRFAGLLATWLDHPVHDLPRDLVAALGAFDAASAEKRVEAAVERVARLASTNERIRNRNVLCDRGFIRQKLDVLDAHEREAIEIGTGSATLTFLYGLDRNIES